MDKLECVRDRVFDDTIVLCRQDGEADDWNASTRPAKEHIMRAKKTAADCAMVFQQEQGWSEGEDEV